MKCVSALPLKLPQLTPPNQGYTFLSFPGSVWSFRRASMPCIHDESLSKHFPWTSRFSWRILGWSSQLVGVQGFFPIHGPSTGTIKTLVFFLVHVPGMCFVHMKHVYKSLKKQWEILKCRFWKEQSGGCQLMEQIAIFDWGLWPLAPAKKNEKSPGKLTWRLLENPPWVREDVISYWKNGWNFPATAMLVNSWGW